MPDLTPELELIESVNSRALQVRTKALDVSFNELMGMYFDEELKIDPEYQRLFRWSEEKQSQFVESLLLELPIPPIFVIELEEGVYELIDGLQRFSSYLHLRSMHPERKGEDGKNKALKLSGCDIVKGLNGLTYNELPAALQIKLKRNFVRMEVIRRESDSRLRYHMFKRLNEGGASLSDQEIRNCTIRLLGTDFINFIISCSGNADFRSCLQYLSEESINQRYDQELVLRFFAFKNYRDQYKHNVGDFMTGYLEKVTDGTLPFNYVSERECFEKTFAVLWRSLGDNAFSKCRAGVFSRAFAVYHFETFTIGLQEVLPRLNPADPQQMERLKEALMAIKQDGEFNTLTTGGGLNDPSPMRKRIELVRSKLVNFS